MSYQISFHRPGNWFRPRDSCRGWGGLGSLWLGGFRTEAAQPEGVGLDLAGSGARAGVIISGAGGFADGKAPRIIGLAEIFAMDGQSGNPPPWLDVQFITKGETIEIKNQPLIAPVQKSSIANFFPDPSFRPPPAKKLFGILVRFRPIRFPIGNKFLN